MEYSFCQLAPEDLFWSRSHSYTFWLQIYFPNILILNVLLSYDNVFNSSTKASEFYIINQILLLAKSHIHKCKFLKMNSNNALHKSYNLKVGKLLKP